MAIERKRVEVLGCPIDAITLREGVQWVKKAIAEGKPRQIITANPEILYRARSDAKIRGLLREADLVTADGTGVLWAAEQRGTPLPERVTGIDLAQELLAEGAREGWRFFFLGAAPGVAEEAARRMAEQFPGLVVAGTCHGYFSQQEERDVLRRIAGARPHVLLVALGAPRQEFWIREHLQELQIPVAMGVGGTFDVWSGKVARAPRWVRDLRLEWLARLLKEPKRLGRMMVLPRYMWAVWRTKKHPVRHI